MPRFGLEQVNCGPAFRDKVFGEVVLTLGAPATEDALACVLGRLAGDQQPEVFVRIFDPASSAAVRIPDPMQGCRILVWGECLYPGTPIQAAITEAQLGGYEGVILGGDRKDAAYFEARGLRTWWKPLVGANDGEDANELERVAEFERWVSGGRRSVDPLETCSHETRGLDLSLLESVRSLRAECGRLAVVCRDSAREAARDLITELEVEAAGEDGNAVGAHILVLAETESLPADVTGFRAVWWMGAREDLAAHIDAAKRRGFIFAEPDTAWGVRPSQRRKGEDAAVAALECGNYIEAVARAKEVLRENPRSTIALLVMAEAALEAGNRELFEKLSDRLRVEAATHPRWIELERRAVSRVGSRQMQRLVRHGWRELSRNPAEAKESALMALRCNPKHTDAMLLAAMYFAKREQVNNALAMLLQAAAADPVDTRPLLEIAMVLVRNKRESEALSFVLHAAALTPADGDVQLALADVALRCGRPEIAEEAFQSIPPRHPGSVAARRWREKLQFDARPVEVEERDLIVCYVEISKLHGTGVLVKRMFPEGERMVTLRSSTIYGGVVELPGEHIVLKGSGLTIEQRADVLGKLLKRFRIRRILCVPFAKEDFENALAAQRLSGAPLCTYVMDDQTIHVPRVPAELARQTLMASSLRLAISAEMRDAYEARFGLSMGVMPPLVDSLAPQVPNHWKPTSSAPRAVLVGNIWSPQQFEQLRGLVRASGLKLDWFGNADVPWLPAKKDELKREGIHCRGFIPESELAAQLAKYPFVVVPSGMLDGTEKNEWLTRLSLPSRMVFILTQSFTPMLVLGHPDTAAARFVTNLGVGRCASYDVAEASRAITDLLRPEVRAECIQNAKTATPAFVCRNGGEWVWESLRAGSPLVASWQSFFEPMTASGSLVAGAA